MTMKISFVVVGVCLLTLVAIWLTKIDSDSKQKLYERQQGWNRVYTNMAKDYVVMDTNGWPEITLSNTTTSLPYASNYLITNLYTPPRIIVGGGDWGKYPHPRWIVLLDTHTGEEYLVLTDGNGITTTKLDKP